MVLIGGAAYVAYLLYQNYLASAVPAPVTPATPATPTGTATTAAPTSSANPTPIVPVTLTGSGSSDASGPVAPAPPVQAYPDSNNSGPDLTGAAATLATALTARATSDGVAKGGLVNGQILYTPQQWNYVFNEMNPGNTKNLPSSSQVMSAGNYVYARASAFGSAGLSGFGLGQLIRVGRQHLRTGGRAPVRNYVPVGTPMRRNG